MKEHYDRWMNAAILEAQSCEIDVPVGCVLVDAQGNLVGGGSNIRESKNDLLGHAEISAIRKCWGKIPHGNLLGYTVVSTLEPCLMCASVIRETGIRRLVFGASNPQRGGVSSMYDFLRDGRLGPPLEVIGGVQEEECQLLLSEFFRKIRGKTR